MKIVFVTTRGCTAKIAELVKEGIESEGVSVELVHPSEIIYRELLDQEVIVLGSPACGHESIDAIHMKPLFDSLKEHIRGKKFALFGSYGWGGGKYMRDWEEEIKSYGGILIASGVAISGAPQKSDSACIQLGKLIAKNSKSPQVISEEPVQYSISGGNRSVEDINYTSGWNGFKSLGVFKKVQESINVTSFYLKAIDGSKLPKAKPGQNIAIKFRDRYGKESEVRQYTLSMDVNEDYYRISVKSEEHGKVSKALCSNINEGDIIEATSPMGDFTVKNGIEPVVLIAGGIGITPMLSMAYSLNNDPRDVKLIYSVTDSIYHSFKEEIKLLENSSRNIDVKTVYTIPIIGDVGGRDYTFSRRIKREWMEENLPRNAQFYLCGPTKFMRFIYENLLDMGIDKSQINYEMFDATKDILS